MRRGPSLVVLALLVACDGQTGPVLWQPDSQPVVYMRLDGPIGWSLFRADVRGGTPTRLEVGDREGLFPALSPNGKRLAFVSVTAPGGVLVGREDGSNAQVVFAHGGVDHIAWSPDGSRLVVSVDGEIAIVGADGSNPDTITRAIDIPLTYPSWSRRGRIAATGSLGIYTMALDGSDLRLIVPGDGVEARDPAWSPNGSLLAFALGQYGSSSIFTVNASGGERRRVTPPPDSGVGHTDLGPVWSPSGWWIAFQRQGNMCDGPTCEFRYDVFVVRWDGMPLRNVTKGSTWGGVRPTW